MTVDSKDSKRKSEVTVFQRLSWFLNTLFHQLTAVVTVFVFWVYFDTLALDSLRLWHIILSTGAYVPLMAEGIILFSGDNVWTLNSTRTGKYWPHGVLLGVSFLALTAGIFVETHAKIERGSDHFVSDHAITGLVSWVLAVVSLFLGALSWHSQRLKGIARPVLFKFIHNFIGISCYAIGITSLILGFYLRAFTNLVTEPQQKATVAATIIITVWSLLAAFTSCFNQLRNIFS